MDFLATIIQIFARFLAIIQTLIIFYQYKLYIKIPPVGQVDL